MKEIPSLGDCSCYCQSAVQRTHLGVRLLAADRQCHAPKNSFLCLCVAYSVKNTIHHGGKGGTTGQVPFTIFNHHGRFTRKYRKIHRPWMSGS